MKIRKAFWWLVDHIEDVSVWLVVLGLFAAFVALFANVVGCATLDRVATVEASVASLESQVSVGGGSDSVTSWIYAFGAAIAYPAYRVARGGPLGASTKRS